MGKEFSDFISAVLDKTDIVSLISHYVKLDRKGNTYWACCPFHNEKTPSFSVVPDRQFYHCFGCGEGGNALSFVKKMENVEFIDALKILAEKAGMEMPKLSGGNYRENLMDAKEREKLYELMRDAARHYHENLSNPSAARFNEYLRERKLDGGIVRRFGLGASLDYDEMPKYLASKGYTEAQMRAAGMVDGRGGRVYDVFGERLMYPIIDNMGRVIAFGGRTLEKNPERAKYRNSTQTEIFDKSNVIYGINLLKKRKSEKLPINFVIMVEGYMDVIALHKAGFDTAVASMGTSLTVRQARQLKLFGDLVYISYDGDSAGQKATMRGLDILRETGLTVKVVRLPDGLDPDDVIKRGGSAAYQKLLDEAIPLTAYKIEILRKKYDVKDPDERAKLAIEASKTVIALDNPIEQEQYLNYIAGMTGFSVEVLKRQASLESAVAVTLAEERKAPQFDVADKPAEYDNDTRLYLSCLLWGHDYVDYTANVMGAMPDDFTRRLLEFCKKYGNQSLKYCDTEFFDDELAAVNDIVAYKFVGNDCERTFKDIERKLIIKAMDKEMKAYKERYKATSCLDDLQHIQELAYKIKSLGSTK